MAPACLRGRHGCKTRLNRERVPLGWGRVPGPQASCDCVEYADCRGIGLDRVFAQDEDVSRSIIGDAEFARIKTSYGLPGGMGHALYEVARKPGVSPALKKAAELLPLRTTPSFDLRRRT